MKKALSLVSILLLGVSSMSCQKEDDITGVIVRTSDATVYYTSAELTGKVTSPVTLKEVMFLYGTDKSDLSKSSLANPTAEGDVKVSISNLEDGQQYYYQLVAYVGKTPVYGDVKDFITFVEGPVDLDLPSGKKWASHNLGAQYPTERGKYYSWGETTSKDIFGWTAYKYCKGNYDKLTKYITSKYHSYDGTVDGITELQKSDDAAASALGADWRTPTLEEWVEITENCVLTNSKTNGVSGIIVRSKSDPNNNKKFIFIPMSPGIYRGNNYDENGNAYWTASLNDTSLADQYARVATLSSGSISTKLHSDRCNGLPIRAFSD